MSLKVNFFPLHFIVAILLLIVFVIVFSDTVYTYMSSNIYVNGLIITLFIVCMLWILGVLSYYSRSAKIINKLFTSISPVSIKSSNQASSRRRSLYIASSIVGTLIDNPVTSKVLSQSARVGRLDISQSDTDAIVDSMMESGDRVLGLSKFLTSIFTMLGLFGTFIGLLQTIDGVGRALSSLSDAQNVDVFALVRLLSDPLQGMAVAFSTSLFGLVASLFGNYGNYVASQKLLILAHKFKNFLLAASTAVIKEGEVLEAQDLLLILEDSFTRLNTNLTERLDSLGDNIVSMAQAILRGQEKQDRANRIMVGSFANFEDSMDDVAQSMKKLSLLGNIGLDIMNLIANNKEDLISYLDTHIVKYLQRIEYLNNHLNELTADHLNLTNDSLDALQDVDDSVSEVDHSVQDSVETLEEVGISLKSALGKVNNSVLKVNSSVLDNVEATNNVVDNSLDINDSIQAVELAVQDVNDSTKDVDSSVVNVLGVAGRINESVLDVNDGVNIVNESVLDANDSVKRVNESVLDVKDGVNTVNESVLDANDSVKRVNESVLDVKDGVNTVNESVLDVKDGVNTVNESVLDVNDSVNTVNSSVLDANDGVNAINNSVLDANDSINRVNNSVLDVKDSINGVNNSVLDANDSINRVNNSVLDANDSINRVNNSVLDANDSINGVNNSVLDVKDGINGVNNSVLDVKDGINGVNNSVLDVKDGINGVNNSVLDVKDGINGVNNSVLDVKDGINGVNNSVLDANDSINRVNNSVLDVKDGINRVNNSVLDVKDGINGVNNSVLDANDSINRVNNSVLDVKDGVGFAVDGINGVNNSVLDVKDGINGVNNSVLDTNDSVNRVNNSVLDVKDGVGFAVDGINALVSVNEKGNAISSSILNEAIASTMSLDTMVRTDNIQPMLDIVRAIDDGNNIATEVLDVLQSGNEVSLDLLNVTQDGNNISSAILDSYSEVVETNRDISSSFDNLSVIVSDIANSITSYVPEMNNLLLAFRDDIFVIKDYISNLNDTFVEFSNTLSDNVDSVNNFVSVVSSLDGRMLDLSGALEETIPQLSELVSTSSYNATALTELVESMNTLNSRALEVSDVVNNFAERLLFENTNIAENIDILSEKIAVSSDALASSMDSVVNYFASAAESNLESSHLMSECVESLAVIPDAMAEISNNFESLRDIYSQELQDFTASVSTGLDEVMTTFAYLSNNMNNLDSLIDKFDNFAEINNGAHLETLSMLRENIEYLSSSQAEFLTEFQSRVDYLSSNFSNVADNLQETLVDLNLNMSEQIAQITGLSDALSNYPELTTQFTMNIADNFANLQELMIGLTNEFREVSANMNSIANEIPRQVDAIEANTIVSNELGSTLSELAISNNSLRDSSEVLQEALSYFTNFTDTISSLEQISSNRENSFNGLTEVLVSKFTEMSEQLSYFTELFMNKDSIIAEETVSILQNIAEIVNKMDAFTTDSFESNQMMKEELSTGMSMAVEQIALIKENLGNNISERIIDNLSSVSNNQQFLLERLDEVMPSINSIINYLENESSSLRNITVDNTDVISALGEISNKFDIGNQMQSGAVEAMNYIASNSNQESNSNLLDALLELRTSHMEGNAKLDVVANAIDVLVTEMLNSRDVVQSILDVVSTLSSDKKN